MCPEENFLRCPSETRNEAQASCSACPRKRVLLDQNLDVDWLAVQLVSVIPKQEILDLISNELADAGESFVVVEGARGVINSCPWNLSQVSRRSAQIFQ